MSSTADCRSLSALFFLLALPALACSGDDTPSGDAGVAGDGAAGDGAAMDAGSATDAGGTEGDAGTPGDAGMGPDGGEPAVDAGPACDPACGENEECISVDGTIDCVCAAGFEDDGTGTCVEIDACVVEPTPVSFTKTSNGDEQDCMTAGVCLTRDAAGPLYNAAREAGPRFSDCDASGPAGTEWASGSCATTMGNPSSFGGFIPTLSCSPDTAVGQTLCLHLIDTDVYYDVEFSQWQSGGEGGALAYTRTLVEDNSGGSLACGVAGAICESERGVRMCTCPNGFELDAAGERCIDTDECTADPDSCDPSASCVNTTGSFECHCDRVEFVKTDFGSEEDCITGNVCLTRDDSRSLYNSEASTSFSGGCTSAAPAGTQWAFGTCADAASGDFGPFLGDGFAGCAPPTILHQPACLHLTASDRFIDIRFSSWTRGDGSGTAGGGGFAYTRYQPVDPGVACP